SALPRDEIDRMMREAEQFAAEDHRRREEAETRNNAENLVYQVEKTLREQGDKASAADREAIEKAVGEVKEAVKGSDVQAIKQAVERLTAASHHFAESVYKAASAQGGAGGPSGAGGTASAGASTEGGEEVVDAEIVDEGNEDK
ncbi:MAG: Hsp70 family protein, partial [Actinomycetota bacterium]